MKKFVSWRRVSTKKQGASGLGLEAQTDIISYFVKAENGTLVADFHETYTGKDLAGCTELQKAIKYCKEYDCTLIIAKTDRFRCTIEALQIYDEMDGNIYFCDLPHTDKFTLTLFFALAEREALMVSIRTKAALTAKKERDGDWTNEYGKNTGTTRSDAGKKGGARYAETARESAKLNDNNKRFYRFLLAWEKKNGAVTVGNADECVEELNFLGYKTATGLDFNRNRLFAMIHKVKKFYEAA
jgi:DNA invertase Pin-like site-specific DNA recombinase